MLKEIITTLLILITSYSYSQKKDSITIVNVVDSLIKVATDFRSKGNLNEALIIIQSTEKIIKENWGDKHPQLIEIEYRKASIYKKQKQFNKAEELYNKVLLARSELYGKLHPLYARTLSDLAGLFLETGEIERAKELYNETMIIQEKVLGKESADYANSLYNQGIMYLKIGDYEKSESLYIQARFIQEKVLGKESADYLATTNNLAQVYMEKGRFEKAEPFLLEVKEIREKTIGKENPYYIGSLINLGSSYLFLGNYVKAEPLYLEALTIIKDKLNMTDHQFYRNCLGNLASLYLDMGEYEKAEPLLGDVKSWVENKFGKENVDYAISLNNLANLYMAKKDFNKAEPLYIESITIKNKILGKEHPLNIETLLNLANLYRDNNQLDKAELFFLEAIELSEKILGKDNPNYSKGLLNLATLYEDERKYTDAEKIVAEANDLDLNKIYKAVMFLSESELSKYTNLFIDKSSAIFANTYNRESQKINLGLLPELCYNNALFLKGFLLTSARQLNRLSLESPESYNLIKQLKMQTEKLGLEYLKPINERDSSLVVELENIKNYTEKEIAKIIAPMNSMTKKVYWKDIKSILKPKEAAIEFVSYKLPSDSDLIDSVIYSAVIILPNKEQPLFITLFEENQLKKIISHRIDYKIEKALTSLYSSRGVNPVNTLNIQGLYELIWNSLEIYLKDVETIFYSPTGLLNQINFDAIPINAVVNLSDKYQLIRLVSTRSLVVPDWINKNSNNDAILYGGINYDLDTTLLARDFEVDKKPFVNKEEISFSVNDYNVRSKDENWTYLPGTLNEINGISYILNKAKFSLITFNNKMATEESVKIIGAKKSSPRILHIATHGYFFPEPKNTLQNTMPNYDGTNTFKSSDQPMFRAGLLFAGSNYAWNAGKPFIKGMEDGILTAYEISQMNLSNTELVVLSACETGLGDIHGNEGVYGLQRAFKIAGVKYLMMSLWQVPDEQTSLLMTTFYKKWLKDKLTIHEAFHSAQKELKDKGLDPFYWAGFILVE